jgi:hypothetical protein
MLQYRRQLLPKWFREILGAQYYELFRRPSDAMPYVLFADGQQTDSLA